MNHRDRSYDMNPQPLIAKSHAWILLPPPLLSIYSWLSYYSRTSHRAIADIKRLSNVDDVNDGAGFNVDVSEEQRQLISSLLALANENPASKLKRFEKKYMVVEWIGLWKSFILRSNTHPGSYRVSKFKLFFFYRDNNNEVGIFSSSCWVIGYTFRLSTCISISWNSWLVIATP